MKTTNRPRANPHWNGRRFAVRAVRKHPADCERLTRAFSLLALSQPGLLPPAEPAINGQPPKGRRS